MGMILNQEKVTPDIARELMDICPFGAMEYNDGVLSVNAGCKSCRLCVKKGPEGVVTWEEDPQAEAVNKDEWKGVAVYADMRDGEVHPVTLELIGKARELAAVTSHPVYALLIGCGVENQAEELLHYGVDKVFLYDDEAFRDYRISPYAAAFEDFIRGIRPSSILVGATNLGRSLAPRVAARIGTGLTADCTILQMKENTDLVQIRPAFGGNIMAQIVTPNHRPQFCTARYKVFSAPVRSEETSGEIVSREVTDAMRASGTEVLSVSKKPAEVDISEAQVIVACGRGFAKEKDLDMARELAQLLGGQLAGTRPLVEAGWIDPKQQIGLSGRTVKPKLLITAGISGSVQFVAGMNNAECIVAIDNDPNAAIFDTAHIGIVGDLYEVLPALTEKIKEGQNV